MVEQLLFSPMTALGALPELVLLLVVEVLLMISAIMVDDVEGSEMSNKLKQLLSSTVDPLEDVGLEVVVLVPLLLPLPRLLILSSSSLVS